MRDDLDISLDLTTATSLAVLDDDGISITLEIVRPAESEVRTFAYSEGREELLVVIRDESGTALGLGYAPGGERVSADAIPTLLDRSDRKAYRMGLHALRNALTSREAARRRFLRRRRHEGENARRRLQALVAEIANDDEPSAALAA